jgi:hypothetical protein
MQDVEIIGMLKSYVKATIEGAGALEGAPCQIQGVVDNNDGTQTVTFLWEDNDGTSHTTDLNLPSAIYKFALLQDGQVMVYDATAGVWKNATLTYDSSLNNSSTNAPQTKAVHAGLATKVDKETGKGLSTNDFTNALKTKLDGIEENAQENVIEEVQLNGTALTPDANKAVNIEAVDTIAVNGVAQTITDGAVDLDIANNLITEAQWSQIQALLA